MKMWIPALAAAVIAIWAVWIYNRLVRKRNRVLTAWSDIDVQLTRRHDLVPALVRTVSAYAGHEKTLLDQVTRLRAEAVTTDSPARLARLEDGLEQALGRLFVLAEAYPDLKASENFLQLQRDLVDVENHLQYARRYYNGAVRDLNDRVRQFPDLLVARLFGFEEAEFYAAADAHRAVPAMESGS